MSIVSAFDGRQSDLHERWDEESWTEWFDLVDEIADEREGSRQRILAWWWASKNGPGVSSPPSRVRSVPTSEEAAA